MSVLTGPKYGKISYFECNWSLHNWLGAESELWVILRLFLIFQDLSLMILIKRILIKKSVYQLIYDSCPITQIICFHYYWQHYFLPSFFQLGSDVKWVVCTQPWLYMRPFGQNGYILVAFSVPPPPPRIVGSAQPSPNLFFLRCSFAA